MTTPIWLQTLLNSADQGTKDFGRELASAPFSRTVDAINRSPSLQQDIIDYSTGTGRFEGRGIGRLGIDGANKDAGGYYAIDPISGAETSLVAIGTDRLQGIVNNVINPAADAALVLAHEIQHAFSRADINNLPSGSDPGFVGSRSPHVVWNYLVGEAESQLREYRVAIEIYERELLNYDIDPTASVPLFRYHRVQGTGSATYSVRAESVQQWLAGGQELYRQGLIPSPDYLARVNLAVEIGNNDTTSIALNPYVDHYANGGMPSALDPERLQHVEVTGVSNAGVSVVFSSAGPNPLVVHLTQPIEVLGEGEWNAEICRRVDPMLPPGPVPPTVINGVAFLVVRSVQVDQAGNTVVTTISGDTQIRQAYDHLDAPTGTITDTPDGSGGINRVITTTVDGKAVQISQHATAAAMANGEGPGDFDTTALSIDGNAANNFSLIADALDTQYPTGLDLVNHHDAVDLKGLIAAADPHGPASGTTAPIEGPEGIAWYSNPDVLFASQVATNLQSLMAALQSGNPLPIATAGFNIAGTLTGNSGLIQLGGVLGVASSIDALTKALERGHYGAAAHSSGTAVKGALDTFYAALQSDGSSVDIHIVQRLPELRLISSRGKGNGQNEHRIKESRGDKSMKQAVATNVIAAYAISTKALGQFGTQAFANDSLWRVAA